MRTVALSALPLSSKSEFRIMPAGRFASNDGRPNGAWNLSKQNADRIIAACNSRTSDVLIDYEHAILKQGEAAPAAGWFKRLAWKPDGIYVTDARWTARASSMIDAQEYRYISPLFRHDESGNVQALINIALVNNPGLDGLTDLAALSSAVQPSGMLEDRLLNGFASDWTDNQRRQFIETFGATPAELRATQAACSQVASTAAKSNSAAYFERVFGFPLSRS